MPGELKLIPIKQIRTDGGTRRRETDPMLVEEYAEYPESDFPAVDVSEDSEGHYWLEDGFHRVAAADKRGEKTIRARVRKGERRDAKWRSYSANATNGRPRTPEEKRDNVLDILKDEEWGKKSNRAIAEGCKVSDNFVSKIRKEHEAEQAASTDNVRSSNSGAHVRTSRTGKDGKQYPAEKPQGSKGKEPQSSSPAEREDVQEECPLGKDLTGLKIEDLQVSNAFGALTLAKEIESTFDRLQKLVDQYAQSNAGTKFRGELTPTTKGESEKFRSRHLKNFWDEFKFHRIYAVCRACVAKTGKINKTCQWCKGDGTITANQYDRMPKELKAS